MKQKESGAPPNRKKGGVRQAAPQSTALPPLTLSRRKRIVFALFALFTPFILLALLEVGLRIGDYGGSIALFETPEVFNERYLAPAEHVATRFFPSEQFPPTPPNDMFLAEKPAHGLRIFALGESSAAGFPYPPNAMFTRFVADALRDALPTDTVEVINLGIAATNSYALVDFADEILEQKPDAILIYSGHNEFYGALGIGSTESLGSYPPLIRVYLKLQRLKTVRLLRNSVQQMLSLFSGRRGDDGSSASRMENVARDQRIALGGQTFVNGTRQFETNLSIVVRKFHRAGVPVFIGSLASNLRDQPPLSFTSGDADAARPAMNAFEQASRMLGTGDSLGAANAFSRARDLDVVRFRAPEAFNAIVKRVALRDSAFYVPVAETFAQNAKYGIAGHDLVLEHVHPNSHGYALLGQAYVDAIRSSGVLRTADYQKLRPFSEYEKRMSLSAFDERIAYHEVRTVTTRWPFVPFSKQQDYRGTYTPTDKTDSLAFMVSRGGRKWAEAKADLASYFESMGKIDDAVGEYDGLIRNFPQSERPLSLAAHALLSVNETDRAIPYLERAMQVGPTAYTSYALGVIALRKKDIERAIGLLNTSLRLAPRNPDATYQLSLAYALAQNAEMARSTAIDLYRIAPNYPRLAEWLSTLGVQPQ